MKISDIIAITEASSVATNGGDSVRASSKIDGKNPRIYFIKVNGSVWKKNGTPVQFNGLTHVNAIAKKIGAKEPTKKIQITTLSTEGFSLQENSQYDNAERILADAKIAKANKDIGEFNTLMADYHDLMAQWHESKGRYLAADAEVKKVEQYHAAAQAYF